MHASEWALMCWEGAGLVPDPLAVNELCSLLLSPAAPLPLHHPVQQARGQQARTADARLPHAAPPLPPRHSTHHHQLGALGAPEDPQTLEPELPATRTPSAALGCPLLQGGEPQRACVCDVRPMGCFSTGGSAFTPTAPLPALQGPGVPGSPQLRSPLAHHRGRGAGSEQCLHVEEAGD